MVLQIGQNLILQMHSLNQNALVACAGTVYNRFSQKTGYYFVIPTADKIPG
jgi:hypothetical protein